MHCVGFRLCISYTVLGLILYLLHCVGFGLCISYTAKGLDCVSLTLCWVWIVCLIECIGFWIEYLIHVLSLDCISQCVGLGLSVSYTLLGLDCVSCTLFFVGILHKNCESEV